MGKLPAMNELATALAEKTLDYEYEGKTLREWVKLIGSGRFTEVVRCRDCIWRNKIGCPYMFFSCIPRGDLDFCSDGQREIGGGSNGI